MYPGGGTHIEDQDQKNCVPAIEKLLDILGGKAISILIITSKYVNSD